MLSEYVMTGAIWTRSHGAATMSLKGILSPALTGKDLGQSSPPVTWEGLDCMVSPGVTWKSHARRVCRGITGKGFTERLLVLRGRVLPVQPYLCSLSWNTLPSTALHILR